VKSEDFYKIFLQYPQICTDSRKILPGCLYFALKGDQFNGNLFAADALKKGCSFAVVDDPSVVTNERFILVPDVLGFLQDLARYHRSKLGIPVIGLTGTNGKTTTKELIHSVLKQKYRTVATQGNLNNHIGVPLTVLSAGPSAEILVVEMGANHPGEIAFLCEIAKPTCGLITNIGKAHLDGFGSFEGVVRAKNELYEWIKGSGGDLFVNQDDHLLCDLAGSYPFHSYGTHESAEICGIVPGNDLFLSLKWKSGGEDVNSFIKSQLTGSYNLYNILAAVLSGTHFGLTPEQIRTGIESYVPSNMRSQWVQTANNLLFLDAYNANPSSMELAIRHFASLNFPNPVLILGDMFELGSHAESEHRKIIGLVDQLDFRKVIFTGTEFHRLTCDSERLSFQNVNELIEFLTVNPIKGDHVLIKGSRGMQLEKIVSYL